MKNISIVLAGSAKKSYQQLPKDSPVYLSLQKKLTLLRSDVTCGIHIAKKKIPKLYLKKYGINNLWKINLSRAWRMLYTLQGTESEIRVIILDIVDHKSYDTRFNY